MMSATLPRYHAPVDAPRRDVACPSVRSGEAELQGFQGGYGYWFSTGVPVAMS